MENEKTDLLPNNGRRRNRRRSRSCCATCCSSFSAVFYFAIMLLNLFYFGYFLHLDMLIDNSESYTGKCILFGRSPQNADTFSLDANLSCELSIFGAGGLVFLEIILLVMLICNSIWGKWVRFLKVFEVFLLGASILISLLISIVISLGYSLTCDAQKRYESLKSRCLELSLPDTNIDYGYRMTMIQIASWLVTALFILALLVQLPITLCLCCKKKDERSSRSSDRNLR